MELRLLTPTEIWEGVNPVKEGTETSIFSSREKDNIVTAEVFFTSEKTASGRVRAYARISYDSRWRDARPSLILLPSHDETRRYDDITESLVKAGYVVCFCDYLGREHEGDDSPRTTYPKELSYAQAPECFSHLYSITTTGRETPWFVWAKLARRAITMISELRYVDAERIGLIGVDLGAQIAWQTAGMDGRVRALVPINGGGYLWRRGIPRFPGGDRELPSDDEERAFSAGVGAETYAKLVSCPTYFIVSSNSANTDVDRAGDIISLVPANAKVLLIVRGTASQISVSAYDSLITWLRKNFAHDSAPVPMPEVFFRTDESNLYLHLRCAEPPTSVSAYFSSGEPVSFARTWAPLSAPQTVGEDEYVYRVPVSDPKELTVAFATVKNADGIMSSSRVAGVIPADMGASASPDATTATPHIVYSGNMGTGVFWVTTDDFFLDEGVLSVKTGPFGISGVSVSKGRLVLCRTSRGDFSCAKNAVMQMDVYSAHRKTVTFTFVSYPDLTRYSCHVELAGGDFWQKVSLSAPECKDEIGKPLSRFGCCKQLIVSGAENAVFNNIVWL